MKKAKDFVQRMRNMAKSKAPGGDNGISQVAEDNSKPPSFSAAVDPQWKPKKTVRNVDSFAIPEKFL